MEARTQNPATAVPDAGKAIQQLMASAYKTGVSPTILSLAHLRASQINGCSSCVASGSAAMKKAGESDERVFSVGAWRDAPYFTEAERAALELTEAVTRLADRPDPVPDEIYDAAAKHFSERELAALILWIATSNLFNRLNIATRQIAGTDGW